MNNDKFDAITGDKFVCCCDCGKWFPSTNAFTKFYSSTAFMLCPKCTNKLEQEIRLYKVEEAPATDVVEVRHGWWERVIPTKSAAKWSTKVSCSNCHSVGYMRYNYCPNCGASMDKGQNEK